MWRACSNAPYKMQSQEAQVLQDVTCSLCSEAPETILHALWECEANRPVWNQYFNWVNRYTTTLGSFSNLVSLIRGNPMSIELFAVTAWLIWTRRNKIRLDETFYLLTDCLSWPDQICRSFTFADPGGGLRGPGPPLGPKKNFSS